MIIKKQNYCKVKKIKFKTLLNQKQHLQKVDKKAKKI